MTCQECRDRLDDRLDRLLSSTDEQRVADHIEHCPDCAREWRALSRLESLLQESARQAAPHPAPATLPRLTRVPRGPHPRVWIAAAAVLLVVWTVLDASTPESTVSAPGPRAAVARAMRAEPDAALTAAETTPPDPAETEDIGEIEGTDWLPNLRRWSQATAAARLSLETTLRACRWEWQGQVVEQLQGPVNEETELWVRVAGELDVDAARTSLRRLLRTQPTLRGPALVALARLHDPQAPASALADWRAGRSPEFAWDALAIADPATAVQCLLEDLRRDDRRADAAPRLIALGPRTESELTARLAQGDRRMVREAVEAAGRLRLPGLARALAPLLTNAGLRADVARAVIAQGQADSLPALMAVMDDPAIAALVADGLPNFGEAGHTRLRELLAGAVPALRSRAAELLGRSGDRTAVAELCRTLGDPRLRRPAMQALAALRDPSAIAHLTPWVDEPNWAPDAIAALGAIGGPATLEPLTRAARRPATCLVALEALGQGQVAAGMPLLLAGLNRSWTAAASARGLAALGDRKAVPALISALHRRDVREDALTALRRLTRRDFGPNPAAWQSWWQLEGKDSRRSPDSPKPGAGRESRPA